MAHGHVIITTDTQLIEIRPQWLGEVGSSPSYYGSPERQHNKRELLPRSSGTSVLKAAQTVAAGKTFDGGMKVFDRGVTCTGQAEGSSSDAVFIIESGGTLSNVIIGPNQIEGIHCKGGCTLNNVWWSDVCEDAFTIKTQTESQTTYIKGGGAFGAAEKVIQHNGAGTVSVSDFTVGDFGKLYRSCGNCKNMYKRNVVLNNITATSGKILVGINSNYGDSAKLSDITVSSVKNICAKYKGTSDNSKEPTLSGYGPDAKYCLYTDNDIVTKVLANGLRLSGSRTCRTVDTLMISRFHGKLEKSWTMIASFLVRKSSPQLYALLILHKKLLFPRSLKHEWFKTQLEEKVLKSASFLGLIVELKRQKKKSLTFKSFFIINLRPLSLQVLYYSSYPTYNISEKHVYYFVAIGNPMF
ncbi:Pectate lyase [Lachancea thermotolerans]